MTLPACPNDVPDPASSPTTRALAAFLRTHPGFTCCHVEPEPGLSALLVSAPTADDDVATDTAVVYTLSGLRDWLGY